jgi:hypothetical protein
MLQAIRLTRPVLPYTNRMIASMEREPTEERDSCCYDMYPSTRLEQPLSARAATPSFLKRCNAKMDSSVSLSKEHSTYIDAEDNGTPQRARVLTALLFVGELSCVMIQREYEVCHNTPPVSTAIRGCISSASSQTVPLRTLERSSTSTFVFAVLAYSILVARHYHINRHDRLQRLCLILGLMSGIAACYPSFTEPGPQQVFVSPLSFTITIALALSTMGHFLVDMLIVSVHAGGKADEDTCTQHVVSEAQEKAGAVEVV